MIAQKSSGEYIQINAGAVILACGGYARNPEYLREAGYYSAEDVVTFIPGFNGDAITMGREVGADDILYKATALQQPTVTGAPGGEYGTFGNGNALVVSSRSANNLWVNETGERFCDENSGAENWMALIIPQLLHKKCYSIYDRKAFETNFYGGPTAYDRTTSWQYDDEKSLEQFEAHYADNEAKDCVVADSLEELCEKAAKQFEEIDEDRLLETITHYNEMCRTGSDTDFGKAAEFMQEFAAPPFYMIYTPPSVMVTYGGLANDRHFRVLDKKRNPINGLYVVGNDSCDLWPNIYTINVQCGTSANHIYGGRTAAKSAADYIGTPSGKITTEGDCTPCEVVYEYEMPSSLKDGTYTSSDSYMGMFGGIRATVTVKDGKITEITGEHEMETPYVGGYAIRDLSAAIVEAQDVNVDTVAGATATSCGFCLAVEDALGQAK
ncbi:MAG: FAD-binding protein [Lachnospiraceae bacterium]|nr:FAD-binding protein [Lachnospiraceae bacterium]